MKLGQSDSVWENGLSWKVREIDRSEWMENKERRGIQGPEIMGEIRQKFGSHGRMYG